MGRNSKVLLYDDTGWSPDQGLQQLALVSAWTVGTRLFRGKSIGASSWREAYADLEEHQSENGPIRELHVWGHGRRGKPYFGRAADLDVATLGRVLPELDVVWWRSCSVHGGPMGKKFATAITEMTPNGVISIGHCVVISHPYFWQQRACSGLRPGEAPWWEMREDGVWVNASNLTPLPAVSTFRSRAPYSVDTAWAD